MPYIITDSVTVLTIGEKVFQVVKSEPYHSQFTELVLQGEDAAAKALHLAHNKAETIIPLPFSVVDGELRYNGRVVNSSIGKRVVEMSKQGLEVEPALLFIKNLDYNPSNNSIVQLYDFLQNNDLPMTSDGCFIAFKKINSDYTDCFTGKISNAIGEVVSMRRGDVNDDKYETCSHGLHVCSYEYLRSFGGGRLVAVKVNPKDVVSVPTDYENSKMRVCEYTVVEELDEDEVIKNNGKFDSAVY